MGLAKNGNFRKTAVFEFTYNLGKAYFFIWDLKMSGSIGGSTVTLKHSNHGKHGYHGNHIATMVTMVIMVTI